jgi:hypothetical protein
MSDDTTPEPIGRTRKPKAPLTEVGIMAAMESLVVQLVDQSAEQRVALYFASRAGLDIRKFLANGDGMPRLTAPGPAF